MSTQRSYPACGSRRKSRLLSIDGGGMRGLSSLLILKEILYRIQQLRKLNDLPRPYEMFDLAGGTGSGGLIVILLFRLRMSIDDAIQAYVRISETLKKRRSRQRTTLDASLIESELRKIIQGVIGTGHDAKEPCMLDEEGPKCFVCALPQPNMSSPTLFRSWTPAANKTYNCTILEACKATTAEGFSGIEIGEPHLKETYIGGSLLCNNPVKHVVEEAKSTFPDRTISCVVSIGAGFKGVIGMRGSRDSAIRLLEKIATDCESTSEDISRQFSPGVYFRLNVEQGLQGINLAELEDMPVIQTHTQTHLKLHKVDQEVDRLVRVLIGSSDCQTSPPNTPSTPEAFKELQKSIAISAYYDSEERSTSSECLDGTRKKQLKTLKQWIKANDKTKPLFVVLGPVGCGKSSLLRTVARKSKDRRRLAASFFFAGTDTTRNAAKSLISTIAYQIAEAIPELRPYVAQSIDAEPTIFSRSLETQTQRLLLDPLNRLKSDQPDFPFNSHPHVIVIDALDECLVFDDQSRVIFALAKMLAHESFPFLCLLSSRCNPHIEKNLRDTLASRIYGELDLGRDGKDERSDIRTYLQANVNRIRSKHAFGTRIPQDWPSESDLETVVKKSGGQFLYASTVVRYIESPEHNPHERLRHILGISTSESGEDPFAELDELYRTLMKSVKNLTSAIEILGLKLVYRSYSQFWTPDTLAWYFSFDTHFQSLDADIVLAPLSSVLQCKKGQIRFYHSSFAEFLLDSARSGKYFVRPTDWQKWFVSRLVPYFYKCKWILTSDVEYLVKEARPGTDLHQAIDEGLALVTNPSGSSPSGGQFNIWPFVTCAFFLDLDFLISIDKMAKVFIRREESLVPFPILLKLAVATELSNSFLLFELCWTFEEWRKSGALKEFESRYPTHIAPDRLLLYMTYLASYAENQNYLSPNDYNSASLRCLWYLQTPTCDIRRSLLQQCDLLRYLPLTFGVFSYLVGTSTNLARGALDALLFLLPHAVSPSDNLLSALKLPFNRDVLRRTPSSSQKVLHAIHDYLMQHDPEYQQGQGSVLAGQTEPGDDEPLVEFEVFLHRKGAKIPSWIRNGENTDCSVFHSRATSLCPSSCDFKGSSESKPFRERKRTSSVP